MLCETESGESCVESPLKIALRRFVNCSAAELQHNHDDKHSTMQRLEFGTTIIRATAKPVNTKHVDPMLFLCWATGCKGAPTKKHRWVNASRLVSKDKTHHREIAIGVIRVARCPGGT